VRYMDRVMRQRQKTRSKGAAERGEKVK